MSLVSAWLNRLDPRIPEIDLIGAIKKNPQIAVDAVSVIERKLPITTAIGTIIMEVAPNALIQAESAITGFLNAHGLNAADPEAVAMLKTVFGAFGITDESEG